VTHKRSGTDGAITRKPRRRTTLIPPQSIAALRRQEWELADFIDNAAVGLHWLGPDGRIIWANRTELTMLGYTAEEYIGRHIADFHLSQDAVRDILERLKRNQTLRDYEAQLRCKDGGIKHVVISANVLWLNGRFVHTRTFTRDITEQKLAQQALQRAHDELEQRVRERTAELVRANGELYAEVLHRQQADQILSRLAAIVESSGDAIMSLTLGGRILTWNRGAEQLYGYAAEEIEGRRIVQLVPSERQEHVLKLFEQIHAGESIDHDESICLRKDGARVEVLVSMWPIRNSAGAVTGASLIARDVAERHRLQQQLAQAQKFEMIGQLAAGIAHEINTPVQYIGNNIGFVEQGFASLQRFIVASQELIERVRLGTAGLEDAQRVQALSSELDIPYFQKEIGDALAQSKDGVARVARIVRSIKELAHPGQGRKTPVDLRRLIDSALTMTRNEWKFIADATTEFDTDLPVVMGIEDELHQVLVNILINAAQAIEEVANDGTGAKGEIAVSARHDGDWVEIRIRDTGPGIPEAARPKLFEPFFTTKEVGKGTGQGLAIARSVIADRHGGTLTFTSESGKGTTFIIRLPAGAPSEPAQPGRWQDAPANGSVRR